MWGTKCILISVYNVFFVLFLLVLFLNVIKKGHLNRCDFDPVATYFTENMVVTISLWCKHTLLAIKNQNITSIIWKYDIYIHFTISSSCKSFSLICFHSVWQNTGILIFFLSISSLSILCLVTADHPPCLCVYACLCMLEHTRSGGVSHWSTRLRSLP